MSATASGYVSRILSVVVGLTVLPIGLTAYGAATFGVWITASSLAQYATNGALGMPLAVLTAVAGSKTRTEAARIAAQGIRIVLASTAAIGATAAGLWLAVPSWPVVVFGELGRTADVVSAVGILLVGTLAVQPLQVYANVLAGRHRIVARDVYVVVLTVGRLGALLVATTLDERLVTLAAITVAVELAVATGRAVHVTLMERVPVHRYLLDRSVIKRGLLPSGMRFFTLQIESTVIRNTDNIVISSLLGPAAVSIYAAPFRLVTAASSLIEAVQGPLWPAYGAARLRGDWAWIRRAHERVLALGLALGGGLWIGVVGYGTPVIHLWLGSDFPVDPYVLLALGAYGFIATWVNANAILLNALDATQSQIFSGGAEAVVNVTSSILLAPVLGLAGVASGTVLGAASVSSWFLPLDVRRRTGGKLAPQIRDLLAAATYTIPIVVATHLAILNVAGPLRYLLPAGALLAQLAFSTLLFRVEFVQFLNLRRSP